jgi:hypothetical protein
LDAFVVTVSPSTRGSYASTHASASAASFVQKVGLSSVPIQRTGVASQVSSAYPSGTALRHGRMAVQMS